MKDIIANGIETCSITEQLYHDILRDFGPTSGTVVISKLEDGRCQVRTPVALVDLAVWSFPWFSPKLA